MKKIAPEMDALMWGLAEEKNDHAVEEFIRRYPEHRPELMRRMKAVDGLKRLKPTVKDRPVFKPSAGASASVRGPATRRAAFAVGALVLAAIGLGAFTVTYLGQGEPPHPVTQPISSAPPIKHMSEPAVIKEETPPPQPESSEGQKPSLQPPVEGHLIAHMEVKGAPLSAILKAVGAQAGMDVVMAPGFKDDPILDVEFDDKSAMAILTELGEIHGFTAFDQGDGTIIVVPAVDSGHKINPSPAVDGDTRRLNG